MLNVPPFTAYGLSQGTGSRHSLRLVSREESAVAFSRTTNKGCAAITSCNDLSIAL